MSRKEIKFFIDTEYKKCSSCGAETNCYKSFYIQNLQQKTEEFITCGPSCLSKHLPNCVFDKWSLISKWLFCFTLACTSMFLLIKICGK